MLNFNQTKNPILDAVEKIYDATKDSAFKQDVFDTCNNSIEIVASFLMCTNEQAVILAIIFQSEIENDIFTIKGLLEHVDLKTSSAININEILIPMVEKEWVTPKKDPKLYPLTEYFVNNKFVRSILTGKLQKIDSEKITTSFQLLSQFQKKLTDRNNRRISYNQLIEWTNELISKNPDIDLADFILKMKMNPLDATHFMYACLQHYNGTENCDYDDIIKNLLPSKEQQYQLRISFKSKNNYLLANGLLKEVESDNFFGGITYRLTEKAIQAFDKNAVVKDKIPQGLLQQYEPETIAEKKLIFDNNEQKLVNKLHDMLSPDNFSRLTERLDKQGMKKGISVLLYGQPGTGKTEAVLQLGKSSNRYILMADASKIRSKWVGETEKNMKALFDEYRKAIKEFNQTPILLFNEADAILGKRISLSNRGDQMENVMQNILLQELENFEGIFIATTNLVDNLDQAFDRRFLYKIRFEKPGNQTVFQIWKSKFPKIKTSVLKNICAKTVLSGGQIENIRKKIAVDSLLDEKLKINETYLLQLAEQELTLENKHVRGRIGFVR